MCVVWLGGRGGYHEVPENGLLELNVPEVGRSLLLAWRAFYSAEHHVQELHHQHPIGFFGYRGPECSHFLRRETAWKGLALTSGVTQLMGEANEEIGG